MTRIAVGSSGAVSLAQAGQASPLVPPLTIGPPPVGAVIGRVRFPLLLCFPPLFFPFVHNDPSQDGLRTILFISAAVLRFFGRSAFELSATASDPPRFFLSKILFGRCFRCHRSEGSSKCPPANLLSPGLGGLRKQIPFPVEYSVCAFSPSFLRACSKYSLLRGEGFPSSSRFFFLGGSLMVIRLPPYAFSLSFA